MLCTNRQNCCLPFDMAHIMLTSGVDWVQVLTCYSCYTIFESVWSETVFVRCLNKNGSAKIQATLCNKILFEASQTCYCDLWKVTKDLQRTFSIQSTNVQMAQGLFREQRSVRWTLCRKIFNLKNGWEYGKNEDSSDIRSLTDVEIDHWWVKFEPVYHPSDLTQD